MRHVLLILLLISSSILFAQVVNIENKRANDGTYGFSGALDLTLSAQQQKDLLITFHFKPLIQYKFNGKSDKKLKEDAEGHVDNLDDDAVKAHTLPDKNKHLILLVNDLKYTGARNNTYANFGMSHLRYAYRIANSGWKWESYAQIQYNKLLLQKVRSVIGTGVRAKIFDYGAREGGYNKRAIRLFAGTSIFYEYEEINHSARPMEFNNDFRWSTYLSSYFNFKYFEFTSSTYLQPNLGQFSDIRISGDYSMLLRISNPFSVKLNFSHFFDSKPPETVIPNTFSISAGFVYKLDNFKIDKEKMALMKKTREERRLKRAEERLRDREDFAPTEDVIIIE